MSATCRKLLWLCGQAKRGKARRGISEARRRRRSRSRRESEKLGE